MVSEYNRLGFQAMYVIGMVFHSTRLSVSEKAFAADKRVW